MKKILLLSMFIIFFNILFATKAYALNCCTAGDNYSGGECIKAGSPPQTYPACNGLSSYTCDTTQKPPLCVPVNNNPCCNTGDSLNISGTRCISGLSGTDYAVCGESANLTCDKSQSPPQCINSSNSSNNTGPGTVGGIFGTITPPDALKNLLGPSVTGEQGISSVLSKVVELIYIFAAILFVFYILYAALKFIYSEGHKESVQDAKSTITWAIIGVIFMSLSFVILRIVGNITGFKFFN
ncbi:hypothetical protein HY025_02780 [Candidatus Daviesbacteria bacterium]|nr:hypothetical protein [Candidatus Daviesbacteria bacterium]